MKWSVFIPAWLSCIILSGCITDYIAQGIDEEQNILVVEGHISQGESYISLSKSANLNDVAFFEFINNAVVYVECDDGARMYAENPIYNAGFSNNRYVIQTENLQFDRKYRLKIEIEEIDTSSEGCIFQNGVYVNCPVKTIEYCSDYAYPIVTPEIDSVFWTKSGPGQFVQIHVTTHDPEQQALHYKWSYQEDWEIKSDVLPINIPYPSTCWNFEKSRDILIGSGEKTVFGNVSGIIATLPPTSRKLEVMYRIIVQQNSISKRAYDYFANIKKNTQKMGGLFDPIPSELRGNITCITEPDRPVIGFIDVSLTTQRKLYIAREEGVYEFIPRLWDCDMISEESLAELFEGKDIPKEYVPYFSELGMSLYYIIDKCVDCTLFGTTDKPTDWSD